MKAHMMNAIAPSKLDKTRIFFLPIRSASLPPKSIPIPPTDIAIVIILPAASLLNPSLAVSKIVSSG